MYRPDRISDETYDTPLKSNDNLFLCPSRKVRIRDASAVYRRRGRLRSPGAGYDGSFACEAIATRGPPPREVQCFQY